MYGGVYCQASSISNIKLFDCLSRKACFDAALWSRYTKLPLKLYDSGYIMKLITLHCHPQNTRVRIPGNQIQANTQQNTCPWKITVYLWKITVTLKNPRSVQHRGKVRSDVIPF